MEEKKKTASENLIKLEKLTHGLIPRSISRGESLNLPTGLGRGLSSRNPSQSKKKDHDEPDRKKIEEKELMRYSSSGA